MKLKLAIFDMDGTLFDTRKAVYEAYKTVVKQMGKTFSMEEKVFYKKCFGKRYRYFLPNEFNLLPEEAEEVYRLKTELYPRFLSDKSSKNEVLFDILQAMSKQYYIAMVTTASKKNVRDILTYFDCNKFFDLILTAEDVVKGKPNAESNLKAMKFFSVESKNTVIFKDMEECLLAAEGIGAAVFKVEAFGRGE